MRTDTQNFTVTMVWEECCNCGMPFGLTQEFQNRRVKDHKNFHCPRGHAQHYYGKTAQEKKIEQLNRVVGNLRDHTDVLTREQAALTREQRDLARHVAGRYGSAPAQKGAFWRGHTAKECDECVDSCPYPTNRYGFRTAWFDGYGADDPAVPTHAVTPEGTE